MKIKVKYNYGQKIIHNKIQMVITAICIRDTKIQYELEYFHNSELKTIWLDEKIIMGHQNNLTKITGTKITGFINQKNE